MMRQRVVFLKQLPPIVHVKSKIGPFEPGDEAMLKCWEAKVLEKHGFLERKKMSLADLRELLVAEERSQSPIELPDGFYFLLRNEISALKATGEVHASEEMRKMALALLHARLLKLLLFSLSPNEVKGLQVEERFLVNQLARVVESWMRGMESFLEGEEAEGHGGGDI
jgi:hypothetical protein